MGFSHPSVNGRLGFRPNEAWNFGLSGSVGPYFEEESAPSLPPGRDIAITMVSRKGEATSRLALTGEGDVAS